MRIPSKLPGSLSIRGAGGTIFGTGPASYNYAIGGLPFLSAASDLSYGHWWIKRETAPFRKQQYDNAQNPGEQSLEGYWIRSVMSFHGGAGQLYADPVEGTSSSDTEFWQSKGVNVWTPGTVSLLQDTDPLTGPTPLLELVSALFGTNKGVVGISATKVWRFYRDGAGVLQSHSDNAPSAAAMFSITTDGSTIFVHTADGLYKATIPAAIGTALTFTKQYTYVATGGEIGWVKDRIILGSGQSVYELSPSPAGPPAALPTALYTALAASWQWTAITETTAAIYAVGSTGAVSAIYKFVLDNTGDIPTITGGTVACQLPGGETALTAFGYLGTYLAIGTSRGARIAIADSNGDLTYGPLHWDNGTPVYDFCARDHWIWCTYKDSSDTEFKTARIDLGNQLDTLRFAYATDLCVDSADEVDASDCKTVAFFGDSQYLAFSTTTETWCESTTKVFATGYLQSSRIRFNTLEPKVFRSVRVRGPLLDGSLSVAYVSSTGSVTPVFTYGQGQTPGSDDLTLSNVARDFLSLKFTFNRGTPTSAGAQLNGWQIKALPGSPRQRLITLPMWCFDYEIDKLGARVGGEGTALARMLALEDLEASGNVTTFQDLDNETSQDVFIESLEFQQGSPPAHFKQPGSFGGRILITMRTV